ncbi:ubiquitin fusion degradation protein UFD1-domain-containing protein [Scheffersomyces amazonensis]|uniref:ubiquitin fusion degradation protein UFD1-domain-containing protein n=1 Tax=Scheffersomyces amazonensis TaxID=1078765 RepID=UPI00315D680B
MLSTPVFYLNVEENSAGLPPYSDKIILPSSVLQTIVEIIPESDLPHPLIFKITNEHNEKFTYVGVKEFSSEEGIVIMPSKVKTILSKPQSINLSLQSNIPKVTSLKLKPTQLYSNITNWKYFLESVLLKYYTVLTNRQLLIIEDGNFHYEMNIEEINESNDSNIVASIINTDVTLDIIPLNDDMANQQLLEFNSNPHNNIVEVKSSIIVNDIKSFLGGKFIPKIFKFDITSFTSPKIYIKLESSDLFNVDLIGGFDKLTNLENFKYTTMNQDSNIEQNSIPYKYIEVDLKSDEIVNKINRHDEDDDEDDEYKFIYFIPFTWEQDADITLSVSTELDLDSIINQEEIEINEISASQIRCQNCLKVIEKDKYSLHQAFCLRNNKRCPQCNEIFLRVIPETHWHCPQDTFYSNSTLLRFKHQKLFHLHPYTCNQCSKGGSYDNFLDLVIHHKGSECPSKLIQCRFCKLIVAQEESTYQDKFENLTHHENWCGGRTSECYKCGQIFRLRDFKKHLKVHQLQTKEFNQSIKVNFNKCANENCINLIQNYNNNDLNLCDICYGPLYIQQLDPTNIKLQSRLERKYIMQLTKGCGQSWCNNRYCVSSGNGDPQVVGKSIKEVFQFINAELLPQIYYPTLPINSKNKNKTKNDGDKTLNKVWFCVTESLAHKKSLLEVLIEERIYEPEMIYKAVNENSNEQSIRQWLREHQVK